MRKIFQKNIIFLLIFFILSPSISYATSNEEVKTQDKEVKMLPDRTIIDDEKNVTFSRLPQKINVNKQYYLTMYTHYNHYYFEFTVPSNGYIEMKWDKTFLENGEMGRWIVNLTDNKGKDYLYGYPSHEGGMEDEHIYYKIGLKPGTYRLELTPEFRPKESFELPFIINFKATEYFEKEHNSTKQSANQIELDKTYGAIFQEGSQLGPVGPEDFFKFTTVVNGDVNFKIRYNPKYGSGIYTLYDSSGMKIATTNASSHVEEKDDWRTYTFKNLPKGTYILKVYLYDEKIPYEIKVSLQPLFPNYKITSVTDMKKYDAGVGKYLTYINGKGYSQFFYENNTETYQFIPSSWLKAAGLDVQIKTVSGKKMLYIHNPKIKSSVQVEEKATPYIALKTTKVTDMKKHDAGKGYYVTYINGKPYSQFFYENNSGNYQFIPSSWLKAAGLTVELKTVNGAKRLYITNPY